MNDIQQTFTKRKPGRGFRRLLLTVGPGVFIPRPETELLVESAVRYLLDQKNERHTIIDLGAGCGAISLAVATEVKNCDVYAIEKSSTEFAYLIKNIDKYQEKLNEQNSKVIAINKSIEEEINELDSLREKVDAVISNLPYIPNKMMPEVKYYEPEIAFFGGEDGLDLVKVGIDIANNLLKPGGFLCIQHADFQGSSTQETGVPYLLIESTLFKKIEDRRDLNGLPRYSVAIKS